MQNSQNLNSMVTIEENFVQESHFSGAPGVQSYMMASSSQVILPTALVQLECYSERYTFRALIDQGSQRSFVSEKVQTKLQLPTVQRVCHVSGMGGQVSQTSKKECFLTLVSPKNDFKTKFCAVVLPKLTNWLPAAPIFNLDPTELLDLDLADPFFTTPGQIDLVLGADIIPQILLTGTKHSLYGSLLAQNTVFGYYLCGPLPITNTQSFSVQVFEENEEESLNNVLRKFWEIEEVPNSKQISPEDLYCEELYEKTTYRNEEGKYVVKLPFKTEFPETLKLGASKPIAMAQFSRMETKLSKTLEFLQVYNDVLKEYITLDHIEKVTSQ